nr:MAG: YbaB/EbfC family nucleoid-associated protein [Actinomycetota bacterium]
MRQLLKQAQQMQQEMLAAQNELAQQRYEGSAGGGLVTAVVSGSQEVLEIKISPEVVDPSDVEMLEDLVVAAIRQAMENAAAAAAERLGGLTGGLGGLFG